MDEFKKLIELATYKNTIDIKRGETKYHDFNWLLDSIKEEVEEVREEVKASNVAHLEDELSDILWGWVILVEKLKAMKHIESHEAILKRALKKYEERILPLYGDRRDNQVWREVKAQQKEVLEEEKQMRIFREEVREYYKTYYKNSDEAHLIDHADDVCNLALKINHECDEKLIILASYLHDMFNRENRSIHNELAYAYVLKAEDSFLQELSPEALKEVAHAVLEHRASFKGEYYSALSEIISAADRGLPDFEFMVIRSMKFNHGNAKEVYKHISSKYGKNGYAKYPDVYQSILSEELARFKQLADDVTVEKIEKIWENRENNKAL